MSSNTDSKQKSIEGFDALADHGDEVHTGEENEKKAAAYDAVSRLFSAVKAGKLDITVLDSLADWAKNPTAQGPNAGSQPSSAQPVAALGPGSSSDSSEPVSTQDAIKAILADTTLDQGFKMLLRRAYDETAPDHIKVKPDGTPEIVESLRNEVASKETARKALEDELKEERDENKPGSLAGKLKAATAAPAIPAGSVNKATIKAKVDELKHIEEDLETTPLSTKIQGRTDLKAAIDELEQLVS